VIDTKGKIYLVVKEADRAFHCGIVMSPKAEIYFDTKGSNGLPVNPNNYSIGIECTNSGGTSLTTVQYNSLILLVRDICNRWKIPVDRYHIIGHYELDSVTRKGDPISSYSVDGVVNFLNTPVVVQPSVEQIAIELQKHIEEKRVKLMSENRIVFKDMIVGTRENDMHVHWANDLVNLLYDKKIVNGSKQADGTILFNPDVPITRAEVATMIAKAVRCVEETTNSTIKPFDGNLK
jgi:hypothetical protein